MFQIQLSAIIAGKDFKRKVSQASIDEPAAKRRKSAQKSLEFEDYSWKNGMGFQLGLEWFGWWINGMVIRLGRRLGWIWAMITYNFVIWEILIDLKFDR